MKPLLFVSEQILQDLSDQIDANLHRYQAGKFDDLSAQNGWAIESKLVQVDYSALASLDGSERTAEADVRNSRIVHAALSGMTPAIASDERVWVRLVHLECLEYSRKRWLAGKNGDAFKKAVNLHMFARGRTGVRDDNALSRLWWNMHIASIADPDNPGAALEIIVKRADIRMQFVERPGTAARNAIARGVVRGMRRNPEVAADDKTFRSFMVELNRNGAGRLFEALPDGQVDRLIDDCIAGALKRTE